MPHGPRWRPRAARRAMMLLVMPPAALAGATGDAAHGQATTAPAADAAPVVPDPDTTRRDSAFQPDPLLISPDTATGLTDFIADHFAAHEPVYILFGPDEPNVKFQLSFKYRILTDESRLAQAAPVLSGFHFAYSQTSFLDTEILSKPVYDTSYRPAVLWAGQWAVTGPNPVNLTAVGVEAGYQHESNGRAELDSRSMDTIYVEPQFVFGAPDDLHLAVGPRFIGYVGSLTENPDLKDYRGHVELRSVLGFGDGLAVAFTGRLGDDWDNGAVQLDVTYPLGKLLAGGVDVYLEAQYFNGTGETLRDYDQHSQTARFGIALVR